MITAFRIVALTPKGEAGLQNNLNEFNKLPPQTKLMWKAFFKREVTQKPLTLKCIVKSVALSNMLNPADLIKKLNDSMKNENLKIHIDYKIEVKE